MKPPIFIELCAGTAALSLRLQGGPGAKPPVSRMGAKTGYADTILSVLGLYPGQGAESYLWCEPDDGVRGLLQAYTQPDVLREAARILRGWKDEEPRALWERLRAELKAGVSVEGAEGVARYSFVSARTIPQAETRGASAGDYLQRLKADGTQRYPTDHPASALDNLPSLPPTLIARDGRLVMPEEVARLILLMGQSVGRPSTHVGFTGFAGPGSAIDKNPPEALAPRLEDLSAQDWPPVTIAADAKDLTPPKLPDGVICYMDPPYLNTTGYKHDLPREEVVRLARLWADAGATVCISEAEPIPELAADGWHKVEISAHRKGATRTFSKQQAEWLTLSRAPSFVPREPEVFIEAPIVEAVKPVRVKAAPVEVAAAEPQEVRQVDLFGGAP